MQCFYTIHVTIMVSIGVRCLYCCAIVRNLVYWSSEKYYYYYYCYLIMMVMIISVIIIWLFASTVRLGIQIITL